MNISIITFTENGTKLAENQTGFCGHENGGSKKTWIIAI